MLLLSISLCINVYEKLDLVVPFQSQYFSDVDASGYQYMSNYSLYLDSITPFNVKQMETCKLLSKLDNYISSY